MDELRSTYRSYGGDRKLEVVHGKNFSANQIYVSRSPDHHHHHPPPFPHRATKVGKGSPSAVKSWSFNDPEMKRRKRVAKYKVYAVEGRVKASFRKGFRWIKNKCYEIVHGF